MAGATEFFLCVLTLARKIISDVEEGIRREILPAASIFLRKNVLGHEFKFHFPKKSAVPQKMKYFQEQLLTRPISAPSDEN